MVITCDLPQVYGQDGLPGFPFSNTIKGFLYRNFSFSLMQNFLSDIRKNIILP